MANLELTFSELYTKISEYLGFTSYSTAPTGTDLTRCKDITYRGYRRFLFPVEEQTKQPYFWSFLRKEGTLITTNTKWKYQLPEDLVCLAVGMKFTNAENYPPLEVRDDAFILNMRSLATTAAIPRFCAVINSEFNKKTGYRKELQLFPTPNATFTYHYMYIFNPVKPDTSTDFMVGGTVAAETILQCCIAAAELQEKPEQIQAGQAGYQEMKAREMLQTLIQYDKMLNKNLEDTVGLSSPMLSPTQGV